MKSLFFIIYIFLGILTLYQGSKFVDSIFAGKISRLPIESSTANTKKKGNIGISEINKGYNSYISLTPLFQPPLSKTETTNINGEQQISDSPLLRQYQLTGIIYSGGSKSMALIKKRGERESKIYHINDALGIAIIAKIKSDKVYINDRGNTVILPMYYRYKNTPTATRTSTNKNYNKTGSYESAKIVRKVLSRSEVENNVFKKANQILTQIAVSPYMKNGRMEGLRLVRVPRNNIVYQLGGRSGDILKRVNGHELSQIDQMYKLWDNIKDDSAISVDLERNHQIYSYTFDIRE